MTKTYSLKELKPRIYFHMRQYKKNTLVSNVLKFLFLVINVSLRKVAFDGKSFI